MSDKIGDPNPPPTEALPVITSQDVAEYLADILPQLAALAKSSGLRDIGEMVSAVSSVAAIERNSNEE